MQLNPYLTFDGRCRDAFEFYARVLGAEIMMLMTHGESPMADQTPAEIRDRIMHGQLSLDGSILMGADRLPEDRKQPQGFSVTLGIDDPSHAERVFEALAEGGTVQMPMQETFWAFRFGTLVDRFGTPWMINCAKPV